MKKQAIPKQHIYYVRAHVSYGEVAKHVSLLVYYWHKIEAINEYHAIEILLNKYLPANCSLDCKKMLEMTKFQTPGFLYEIDHHTGKSCYAVLCTQNIKNYKYKNFLIWFNNLKDELRNLSPIRIKIRFKNLRNIKSLLQKCFFFKY